MILGEDTAIILDLFTNQDVGLFNLLDNCRTKAGSNLLKEWIASPLTDLDEIISRQDKVAQFLEQNYRLYEVTSELKKIQDSKSVFNKFDKKFSGQQNAVGLQQCVQYYRYATVLRTLNQVLSSYDKYYYPVIDRHSRDIDNLIQLVEQAIDLPRIETEGVYFIKPQFSEDLLAIYESIRQHESEIQAERQSVQERFKMERQPKMVASAQYGFVFEVDKSKCDSAIRSNAKDFKLVSQRRNTNCITTNSLQTSIRKKQAAEQQYDFKQQDLIGQVIDIVGSYTTLLKQLLSIITELDVILSFVDTINSVSVNLIRPVFTNQRKLYIKNGFHPTLLKLSQNPIPNDCYFDIQTNTLNLITGPNMGGKSTYMKTVALICIMAQIGCYVPCEICELPIFDSIYARIGSNDIPALGLSTFMVEMKEVVHVLSNATSNSLILIDEMGRGTSTNEGVSLSRQITIKLADLGIFTLFATHFTELTKIQHPKIKNFNTSVDLSDQGLKMRYKIEEGAMPRSYGIELAEIMGFKQDLINQAKNLRQLFEASSCKS